MVGAMKSCLCAQSLVCVRQRRWDLVVLYASECMCGAPREEGVVELAIAWY